MDQRQSHATDLLTMARFIIDRVALGVMAIDSEQRIMFFNPEAGRICGIDPAASVGRHVRDVFPDFPVEGQVVQRALREGTSCRNIRQDITYHGTELHLLTSAEPVRNDAGGVTGAIVMFSDVAKLVDLEQRARDAEHLASVGRMAAGTVHEIRNPLTTVRGFVQLFSERFAALGQDSDAQLARTVLAEIDRSARLLEEFLQLSRPTPDGWTLVDLAPILSETIRLLTDCRRGAPATLLDISSLPAVFANPDRIKQVLTNLWQNAAEATGPGGHISVVAHGLSDVLVVEVSDDGPGLAPLAEAHLFEPFCTTKETGTGLGLVICRRVVEDHGGLLTVSNRPGGGVVARFTLPLPSAAER